MTVEELARRYHEERISIHSAMLKLLLRKRVEPITVMLVMTLTFTVAFANMGEWDQPIPFETGDKSVREVIDEFGLEPFLEEPWKR